MFVGHVASHAWGRYMIQSHNARLFPNKAGLFPDNGRASIHRYNISLAWGKKRVPRCTRRTPFAEGEGFKPPIPERGIPDFESSAIDHSANLPVK